MFEFQNVELKITKTSHNLEKLGGGGNQRQGVTLAFEFIGSNQMLNMIEQGALELYYRANDNVQGDLIEHIGTPRFTYIKTIPFVYEGLGYKFRIEKALEFSKVYEIADVKVHELFAEIMPEGRCKYTGKFYLHAEQKDIGRLLSLQTRITTVSIIPPPVANVRVAGTGEDNQQPDLLNGDMVDLEGKVVSLRKGEGDPDFDESEKTKKGGKKKAIKADDELR